MVKGGKSTWETRAPGRCELLTAVSETFLYWVEVEAAQGVLVAAALTQVS
jgi:hypothetical protein